MIVRQRAALDIRHVYYTLSEYTNTCSLGIMLAAPEWVMSSFYVYSAISEFLRMTLNSSMAVP